MAEFKWPLPLKHFAKRKLFILYSSKKKGEAGQY